VRHRSRRVRRFFFTDCDVIDVLTVLAARCVELLETAGAGILLSRRR
jgi:hypothetical protein